MKKNSGKYVIKNTASDKIFIFFMYFIGILFASFCLYPLIYVVSASFSHPDMISGGKVWLLPKKAQLTAYAAVLKNTEIWIGYKNTIIYSVVGTFINIVMTTIAAYPISRPDLKGRNLITVMMTFTMFFGGGLIPSFLLVRSLGMYNTMWALVIPGAISVYNVLIMRNFFQTSIPNELVEAAYVDGSSNIRTLLKIVLPLSKPILAVLVIFYFVGHWNSYFSALIYLNDKTKYPLQMFIREILIKSQSFGVDNLDSSTSGQLYVSVQYAIIIVSSLPVLIMYPFMQRFFVKGVMIGSIKG